MPESRLGIDIARSYADVVELDPGGRALAHTRGGDVAAALAALPGAAPRLVVLDAGTLVADALAAGRLARVAVVRIGAPLTLAVPPLAGWPPALRDAVCAGIAVVAGGAEYDGSATPLDEDAIARFLERARPAAVAVTGVFATVAPEQELAAAAVARRTLGAGTPAVLSHELGTVGLLERENATVLNAALTGTLDALAGTLRSALPTSEPYVARGDGTLIALAHALRLPVTMIGSDHASALRGAFRLTGVDDAVVAIAERSSLVLGALRNGIARDAAPPMRIAAVPVALRRPDVVRVADAAGLSAGVKRFAAGAREPVLVVVGGAAERVPESLAGVGEVRHPHDGALVRAFGAAFGEVSGEAERIAPESPERRRDALGEARRAALERAVQYGADPGRVAVIDVEETPLTTLPGSASLIRVRAAGPP